MWTKAFQALLTSYVTVAVSDVLFRFKLALPSLLFLSGDEVKAPHSNFDRRRITQGDFTPAVNSVCGFVKYYYYACTLWSDFMFPVNMARSLRRGHPVDYKALNTLSTVDFEAHFKAKKNRKVDLKFIWSRDWLAGEDRRRRYELFVHSRVQTEFIFNNFRTLNISWNGRIGLHGPAHENLQLIWVSNLSGTRLSLFSGGARDNHPCTQLGSTPGLGSTQSLCFLLINNFIGPYTATLLSPWKGYRVRQLRFCKASYLSLSRMQSKLIIPLSWERIMIYICYLLAGRSAWWKTVTEVLKILPEAVGRGQHF